MGVAVECTVVNPTVEPVLDASLRDAGGRATTLRAVMGAGPLVIVFLRHFG